MVDMEVQALFSLLLLNSHLVWTGQYCIVENGTNIDWSRRHLVDIPRDLPIDAVDLNLSRNVLKFIPSGCFSSMNQLQRLDLSRNKITNIVEGALSGLESLCYLDIRDNDMNFCLLKSYPASLFMATPQLRVLHMDRNKYIGFCKYHPDFYLPLTNIRELSLGTSQSAFPGWTFGRGFTKMNFLEKLFINGGERLYGISDYTFDPFRSSKLNTLTIEHVTWITEGAFSKLVLLDSLIIRRSPGLGLKAALLSLSHLKNHNMTSIVFSGLNPNVPNLLRTTDNFYINNTLLKYLAKICVDNIDLSDNNIIGTTDSFGGRFFKHSRCLKSFNFRGNNLPPVDNLFLLYSLFYEFPNVKYIDVSWTRSKCEQRRLSTLGANNVLSSGSLTNQITTFNCSYNKNVEFVYFKYKMFDVDVLDIAYTSDLPSYENQTWTRLKVFNVSGCELTELDVYTRFGVFTELILLVARALTNFNVERYIDGMPYKVFPKLKILDISDNDISYLLPDSFSGLPLETLDLSGNKLVSLSPAITSLDSLLTLHISFNAITKLEIAERKWIDRMVLKGDKSDKGFNFAADRNPFACVCTTLDFLQWLLETNVVASTVNTSACHFENGTQVSLLELRREFKNFSVGCQSQFWLTFAISIGCVVALGIAASIVSYRHRWNIKYWCLTRCRNKLDYEPIPDRDYPFDAFVAYNHEDYNWACFRLRVALEEGKQRYRLCLHHRDFPVGESIQQNIVDAVNSSRKIILVITRKYLACDWGEFEIQMAGMRMVQEGRENVIIAILLEEIPVRKMPTSLLNMWKHITFLLWKDDPIDEGIFWTRLSDAMVR